MEIGFIDYSREERSKILSALSLLNEPSAVDELGVGTLRDIYADLLFPGISTLQTRAKYFVLIPCLFQLSAEKIKKGNLRNGPELLRWLEDRQDMLVEKLVQNSSPGASGIIGSELLKRDRAVKQKPSSIYWSGLRTLGIVKDISLQAACASFVSLTRQKNEAVPKLDGDTCDDPSAGNIGTVLFSPLPVPEHFFDHAAIELTLEEAQFLREHIQQAPLTRNSMLAFLMRNEPLPSDFKSIPTEHMQDELLQIYDQALSFSDLVRGAYLRYNVIFSQYGAKDSGITAQFEQWRESFCRSAPDLDAMLDPPLPAGHKPCPRSLCSFCRDFDRLVRQGSEARLDALIIAREKQTKGLRAKLNRPGEYRYTKAIHNYSLNFRFDFARTILQDIFTGLGSEV